jgi:hypothetical protein
VANERTRNKSYHKREDRFPTRRQAFGRQGAIQNNYLPRASRPRMLGCADHFDGPFWIIEMAGSDGVSHESPMLAGGQVRQSTRTGLRGGFKLNLRYEPLHRWRSETAFLWGHRSGPRSGYRNRVGHRPRSRLAYDRVCGAELIDIAGTQLSDGPGM